MSDPSLPQVTTTTYAIFQRPGILMPEESVVEVSTRDPHHDASNAPANAYAFYYFDIVTTVVDIGGELVETASDRRNISKTYYINAEVLSYDTVADLPGDNRNLLANMRSGGWDYVARCRTGNFQPFEADKHELIVIG